MPIEIAGITLNRIHRITTVEQAGFVRHQVPGLEGNLVQDLGRNSVHLQVEGICYGEEAQDQLEEIRTLYKKREAVDFLADIVGQAYFAQVVIDQFEVHQQAGMPEQFSYRLLLAEYVEPPQLEQSFFDEVNTDIGLEAGDFMDLLQLPDLLSIPDFGDPTEPLNGMLDSVESTLSPLSDSASLVLDLFADE